MLNTRSHFAITTHQVSLQTHTMGDRSEKEGVGGPIWHEDGIVKILLFSITLNGKREVLERVGKSHKKGRNKVAIKQEVHPHTHKNTHTQLHTHTHVRVILGVRYVPRCYAWKACPKRGATTTQVHTRKALPIA